MSKRDVKVLISAAIVLMLSISYVLYYLLPVREIYESIIADPAQAMFYVAGVLIMIATTFIAFYIGM